MICGVSAQNPAAQSAIQQSQQYDLTREDTQIRQSDQYFGGNTAPEIYPGESDDVGPQFIVRSKPVRKWVEAFADTQYFYTSNMFLTENRFTDTGLLLSTVQVALAPTNLTLDGKPIAPRLGFRHQWYNYGFDQTANQLNNFDFDVQTVFMDTRWAFEKDWVVGISFDWNRLLGHEPPLSDYNTFYDELMPGYTLARQFPLSDTQLFTIEYSGYYHFTHVDPFPLGPTVNDRLDQIIRLVYTHEIIPQLYMQPFYRCQYTYYRRFINETRSDFLNTLGITFSYMIQPWCIARLFTTYDIRETDSAFAPTYKTLNAGAGVSFSYSF
jgi:hypothetical protein